jgi:anti-sigma factor RsiW
MTLRSRLFRRGLSCSEVLEVLQSYLDDEADADVARQVAAHLRDCDRCDRESQVYVKIKASLAGRRRPVDPQVMAALNRFGQELLNEDAE